jgi:hypothetical protein
MQAVLVTLAQNLEFENEAIVGADPSILLAVDHGDRLKEMQLRVSIVASGGERVIRHYRFDSVAVRLLVPFGVQDGFSLGLDARGRLVEETLSSAGAILTTTTAAFDQTFAVRRATGDRWLTVAALPFGGTP